MENELAWMKTTHPNLTMETVEKQIDKLWKAMADSIHAGMKKTGVLPGGLEIERRSKALHDSIQKKASDGLPEDSDDWVNLFAMAVSEENAAGGRIVTSPTNGAAGVIPAVLGYYDKFVSLKIKKTFVNLLQRQVQSDRCINQMLQFQRRRVD